MEEHMMFGLQLLPINSVFVFISGFSVPHVLFSSCTSLQCEKGLMVSCLATVSCYREKS